MPRNRSGVVTIRKGEPWGRQVPRPDAVRVVATDAALAAATAVDGDPVLVIGGDIRRGVGGRTAAAAAPPAGAAVLEVPIDLLAVTIGDGATNGATTRRAAAHVTVGGDGGAVARLLTGGPLRGTGELMVVGNADHIGDADVFPRGHPNDGRFDVLVASAAMRWRARRAANARMRTGTHLPHPQLSVSRASHAEWRFGRPRRVTIDGVPDGETDRLAVTVLPDAATILIAI